METWFDSVAGYFFIQESLSVLRMEERERETVKLNFPFTLL